MRSTQAPHAVLAVQAKLAGDGVVSDGVVSDGRVEWVDEPLRGIRSGRCQQRRLRCGSLGGGTLTNLYNERPQWLVDAHGELDAAVAAAYRWSSDISDAAALRKLLRLHLAH